MTRTQSLFLATLLCLPVAASAGVPGPAALQLPDFTHLARQASESTDISLGSTLLHFASHFAGDMSEDDRRLLAGLQKVEIHAYEFDHDGAWQAADVSGVRQQLQAAGWTRIVQAHDARTGEDVDVCLALDHDAQGRDQANGLAVLVTGPREVTLVHVVGRIDPAALARMGGSIGLPGQATVALRAAPAAHAD